MDGHTSKAVEKAKVVHQGRLSEHDCAGPALVYLHVGQVKRSESQR